MKNGNEIKTKNEQLYDRLNEFGKHVEEKSTGSVDDYCEKENLSRSTVKRYVKEINLALKRAGIDVKIIYDRKIKSYRFSEEGSMKYMYGITFIFFSKKKS
jgi:hypothetical protein